MQALRALVREQLGFRHPGNLLYERFSLLELRRHVALRQSLATCWFVQWVDMLGNGDNDGDNDESRLIKKRERERESELAVLVKSGGVRRKPVPF